MNRQIKEPQKAISMMLLEFAIISISCIELLTTHNLQFLPQIRLAGTAQLAPQSRVGNLGFHKRRPSQRLGRDRVIKELQRIYRYRIDSQGQQYELKDMMITGLRDMWPSLTGAMRVHFGSHRKAWEAVGVDYDMDIKGRVQAAAAGIENAADLGIDLDSLEAPPQFPLTLEEIFAAKVVSDLREGVLRDYAGLNKEGRALTLEEIGQKLGCSRENVRLLLNRAIRCIKRWLRRQGYEVAGYKGLQMYPDRKRTRKDRKPKRRAAEKVITQPAQEAEEPQNKQPELKLAVIKNQEEELNRYKPTVTELGIVLDLMRQWFMDAGFSEERAELTVAQIWFEPDYVTLDRAGYMGALGAIVDTVIALDIPADRYDVLGAIFELAVRYFSHDANMLKMVLREIRDPDMLAALPYYIEIYGFRKDDAVGEIERFKRDFESRRTGVTVPDAPLTLESPLRYTVVIDGEKSFVGVKYKDGFGAGMYYSVEGDTARVSGILESDIREERRFMEALLARLIDYAKAEGIKTILFPPPFAQYRAWSTWNTQDPTPFIAYNFYSRAPYKLGFRLTVSDRTAFSKDLPNIFSFLRWELHLESANAADTGASLTAIVPRQGISSDSGRPDPRGFFLPCTSLVRIAN